VFAVLLANEAPPIPSVLSPVEHPAASDAEAKRNIKLSNRVGSIESTPAQVPMPRHYERQ
jgi:hypothetical protein